MRDDVTILMPVRNAVSFIDDTLASIAAQTHRRLRLMVWDNGSTDGTVERLRHWVPSRISGELLTGRPMGLGASRAELIRLCPTELCAICDADDISGPDRIARQARFMLDHPRVGLCGTHIQLISRNGQPMEGSWDYPCDDAGVRWRMRFANAVMQPTAMMRRSVALKAGNYRDIKPGQDYDLWLRLVPITQMANLPERLVAYRQHDSSVSVVDHVPGATFNRQLVERYVDQLFPGVHREEALRVHALLTTHRGQRVAWRDLRRLRQMATTAACADGLPKDAYRRTGRYRGQIAKLRTRWLRERPGAAWVRQSLSWLRNRSSDELSPARVLPKGW